MNADKPPNVDALIDGVVPEMTGGVPSDALRAAVRRRIDAPPPPTLTWPPWAAAAGVVIVVAAVAWQWDKRAAVQRVPDRAAVNVPAPARSDAVAAPRDASVTLPAGQRASADRAAARAIRPVARQSPEPASEPDTVEIAPLVIDPLRPAVVVADTGRPFADIDIDPIPIRPLAIGALASDDME